MIVKIDTQAGTLTHRCESTGCGAERGVRIDPQQGDVTVSNDPYSDDSSLNIVCARCGATESFRLNVAAYEAGEDSQPGSIVGMRLPHSNGVVHAHHVGWNGDPIAMAQARYLRRLAKHPAIAAIVKARKALHA